MLLTALVFQCLEELVSLIMNYYFAESHSDAFWSSFLFVWTAYSKPIHKRPVFNWVV